MYYPRIENKGADQLRGYAKLICVFVFAYAKSRFSYDAAHLVTVCCTYLRDVHCQLHMVQKSFSILPSAEKQNIIRDSAYFVKSTPLSAFQYYADMIQTHYRGIAAVHGAVKLFSGQLLGFMKLYSDNSTYSY